MIANKTISATLTMLAIATLANETSIRAMCSSRGSSIQVTFKDGVFEPLEDVMGVRPGQSYTVFSDEELDDIRGTLGWLKAAEKSYEFWNNASDVVYDTR